jgi:predicted small metal-binding protein
MKILISSLGIQEKKEYVKILEEEFNNQKAQYDMMTDEIMKKVVDQFKKKHNVDKVVFQIQKLRAQIDGLKGKLHIAGFTGSGEPDTRTVYYDPPDGKKGRFSCQIRKEVCINKEMKKAVDTAIRQSAIGEPTTLKNKLKARIWMCSTVHEANMILKGVLRNDLLPDTPVE